jgi:hypothetical protein
MNPSSFPLGVNKVNRMLILDSNGTGIRAIPRSERLIPGTSFISSCKLLDINPDSKTAFFCLYLMSIHAEM